MSERPTTFVRTELAPSRPPPVIMTGLIGFLRTRLFNSSFNVVLTVLSLALLWAMIVPTVT